MAQFGSVKESKKRSHVNSIAHRAHIKLDKCSHIRSIQLVPSMDQQNFFISVQHDVRKFEVTLSDNHQRSRWPELWHTELSGPHT